MVSLDFVRHISEDALPLQIISHDNARALQIASHENAPPLQLLNLALDIADLRPPNHNSSICVLFFDTAACICSKWRMSEKAGGRGTRRENLVVGKETQYIRA